jgi:hypothetical protein
LSETITVSGRAPIVDATKVAVTANIPSTLVEAIPAIHSGLNDIQKWSPGTAPSRAGDENQYMSVMGSPGFETSWMIEGAMTNSPSSGDIFTAGDPDIRNCRASSRIGKISDRPGRSHERVLKSDQPAGFRLAVERAGR